MTIKKYLKTLIIFLIILIASCENQKARDIENQKELKKVFNSEIFDEGIIDALPTYDSLKNIILSNKEKILSFRDHKKKNDSNQNKDPDSIVQNIGRHYDFILHTGKGQSDNDIGIKTMPAEISAIVETICMELGPRRLVGFYLDNYDSSLAIIVKYNENADIETQHIMQWNWDYTQQNVPFVKDTILGSKWIYYIRSEKKPGI